MATYPCCLVTLCILALFLQNARSCGGGCGFPTSGGNFAVSSYSPNSPVGIAICSENMYEGDLCIQGNLPLLGSAALEGEFGTRGVGEVCYTCGDSDIGIDSTGCGASSGSCCNKCGCSNGGCSCCDLSSCCNNCGCNNVGSCGCGCTKSASCCAKCSCDKCISLNIHPDCCFNINPMWTVDPSSICLCPDFGFNIDNGLSNCCQCSNTGFNIDNCLDCCKRQDCCQCSGNGFSSNSNFGSGNGFSNSNSFALLKRFGLSGCWYPNNMYSSPFGRRLHELLHGNDCDCGCNCGFGLSCGCGCGCGCGCCSC